MSGPEFSMLNPPTPLIMRGVDWFINYYAARCLKLEIVASDSRQQAAQIKILNSRERPFILHATDWSIGKKRSRRSFDSVVWDEEILPQNTLIICFSPYGVLRKNVWRFSEGKDFQSLRFRVHSDSGMTRSFYPGRELIDCLMRPNPDR